MGLFDRILARIDPGRTDQSAGTRLGGIPQRPSADRPITEDELAVERYRYLLRTAPPDRLEQAHEEAFARLTPEQRRLLFDELRRQAPAGDAPRGDDAHSLAEASTRAEVREPGFMERILGRSAAPRDAAGSAVGAANGPRMGGFGQTLGASLLGAVAGTVIGSAVMSAFLPPLDAGGFAEGAEGGDAEAAGDVGGDDLGGGFGDWTGGGFDGGGIEF